MYLTVWFEVETYNRAYGHEAKLSPTQNLVFIVLLCHCLYIAFSGKFMPLHAIWWQVGRCDVGMVAVWLAVERLCQEELV